jgi:glucose-6-phosphate isomerase
MLKVNLGGCSSFVNDAEYKEYVNKALSCLEVLENETGAGNDFLGWKHLPSETLKSTLVADCQAIKAEWESKGIDLVVVIGIGGSYLGAKCAIEALSHQFGKQLKNKGNAPEIVFAGQNLSEEYMCELMDLVQERNAACVVISKSGTTTEPAVAFRLVKKYLEDTYGKEEAAGRIVAVTDKARGALKGLATQEGYRTFVIEDNVGGRFSVLTPVGILPIVLAGFDMNEILRGALEMEEACAKACECNPAVQYAAMRNALYAMGKKIEILVAYNPKLTSLGE